MQRIDLAFRQHLSQRFRRPNALDVELVRQFNSNLLVAVRFLFTTAVIVNRGYVDIVMISQNAADPHRRGHLIFRCANFFAD